MVSRSEGEGMKGVTPLLRTALKSYRWIRLTLIERAPARGAKPHKPEISTVADQITQ